MRLRAAVVLLIAFVLHLLVPLATPPEPPVVDAPLQVAAVLDGGDASECWLPRAGSELGRHVDIGVWRWLREGERVTRSARVPHLRDRAAPPHHRTTYPTRRALARRLAPRTAAEPA